MSDLRSDDLGDGLRSVEARAIGMSVGYTTLDTRPHTVRVYRGSEGARRLELLDADGIVRAVEQSP